MKNKLPVVILVGGVAVLLAGVVFWKMTKSSTQTAKENNQQDQVVAEISQNKKPFAALIPSIDGHWLKLKIEGLDRLGAKSMDYELLYKIADGRTQGVPGTITLKGDKKITRDLLLGSESSGKFRYDEGVNQGTLTLRFRDGSGKLLGKLSTDFTLTRSSKGFMVAMDSFSDGRSQFSSQ